MQQSEYLRAVAAARSNAEADNLNDFTEKFDATSFDEELETDERWMGLVRNESNALEVHAEFVYDGNVDADGNKTGMGWYL